MLEILASLPAALGAASGSNEYDVKGWQQRTSNMLFGYGFVEDSLTLLEAAMSTSKLHVNYKQIYTVFKHPDMETPFWQRT